MERAHAGRLPPAVFPVPGGLADGLTGARARRIRALPEAMISRLRPHKPH